MYSAYNLNKQSDNIQPWHTPFLIWDQFVVPCPVLTVASWPAYRFLKRQVKWSGISISFRIFQFVVMHTVKGFGIFNKAEVKVFLELPCFFNDPMDVGNLIIASSPITSWQIDGETVETVIDFILGGSKVTEDGDYSHEIKRCLLFGRKVMTNRDSIFKSRDVTLPTKVRLVKAMVFPVVMFGCESWTIKKA